MRCKLTEAPTAKALPSSRKRRRRFGTKHRSQAIEDFLSNSSLLVAVEQSRDLPFNCLHPKFLSKPVGRRSVFREQEVALRPDKTEDETIRPLQFRLYPRDELRVMLLTVRTTMQFKGRMIGDNSIMAQTAGCQAAADGPCPNIGMLFH